MIIFPLPLLSTRISKFRVFNIHMSPRVHPDVLYMYDLSAQRRFHIWAFSLLLPRAAILARVGRLYIQKIEKKK